MNRDINSGTQYGYCKQSMLIMSKLRIFNLKSTLYRWIGAVAKLVEYKSRVMEIGTLVPSRVKATKYKIDTCRFRASRSTLI